MKKELVAITLILLAFSTGMILTAATSGCDAQVDKSQAVQTVHSPSTHARPTANSAL